MIFSGIDMVHIQRFKNWSTYTDNQLSTIFSLNEITEFNARGQQGYHFLASRFAVKEACYKALSSACARIPSLQPFGLRTIARFIEITHDPRWGCPEIIFNVSGFQQATGISLPAFKTSVSISHEHEYAIAHVLITLI